MREHVLVSIGWSECDFDCLSVSLSVCLHLRVHCCTPMVLVIPLGAYCQTRDTAATIVYNDQTIFMYYECYFMIRDFDDLMI